MQNLIGNLFSTTIFIPDVNLSIGNFAQFFEERKIILIKKLSDLLS